MIEITLVCGPTGAGKATWIARKLRAGNAMEHPAHILVQDTGCDGTHPYQQLLECLVATAGSAHGDSESQAPDRVFVEVPHQQDVRAIIARIGEHPILQRNFAVTELVVVVRSCDGLERLRGDASLRLGITLADTLVISVVGSASLAQVSRLAARLRWLSPGANILGTECTQDMDGPLPVEASDAKPWSVAPACGNESWQRPAMVAQRLPHDVSWPHLALWLDAVNRAHPDQLLKATGVVNTPNGPLALRSFGGVLARPVPSPPQTGPPEKNSSTIVFTTQGMDPELLTRSFSAFVLQAS